MNDTYAELADLPVSALWGQQDPRIAEHLTLIGDIDLREPDYSFDLLRFWVRKSDGMVLYATDSGCSCPIPFEETTVGELKETTLAGVERVARSHAYPHTSYSAVPAVDIVQGARALMPAMREAGAR